MMIDSKIYKGIEYVQLNELPLTQREKITQSLSNELLIKIMIDGQIISDCLQYKDYSFWYNTVFKPKSESLTEPASPLGKFETKLAFK
jgi:hypothetical protein